jgi:ArsR family transcriptional regulator
VCEIQSVLKIAQPTVSKHLKILEEAGLVAHKKEGLWVVYELTKGEKSPYAALILGNLRHWFEADPWWGKIREKLLTLDRYKAAEEAKLCRGKRWKKV